MIKQSIFFLIVLIASATTQAQPKLFSSDWPVWNLTEGMHKEGMLDDFSYQMKTYDTSLKWFRAGNLDLTFMTLYDFISIQPTKIPTVIIGVSDYSNGGDKIILRKNIKDPKDLNGKKILLATNSISLWLLHNYLAEQGLTLDDVVIENQSVNLAPLQFKEDLSFSAVVGWNPSIDNALTEDSFIASTSADYPRAIYDLVVATKDFVNSHPALSENFLNDYLKSILSDSVIEKTASGLSVSGEEYRSWLGDAHIFKSRKEANKERQNLLENAEKIRAFLSKTPNSVKHPETKSRFKPRDINIDTLVNF